MVFHFHSIQVKWELIFTFPTLCTTRSILRVILKESYTVKFNMWVRVGVEQELT